jgi:hypothetical protein
MGVIAGIFALTGRWLNCRSAVSLAFAAVVQRIRYLQFIKPSQRLSVGWQYRDVPESLQGAA